MKTLSEQLEEANDRVWRNVYAKIKAMNTNIPLVMVRRKMSQSEVFDRYPKPGEDQ